MWLFAKRGKRAFDSLACNFMPEGHRRVRKVQHTAPETHDLRNEIVEELNPIRGTKAVLNGRVILCGMEEAAGERDEKAEEEGKR